jgi:hypothetical protein
MMTAMLRHTVMFRWAEGTTDAQIDEISQNLDSAVAVIPAIAEYRHGRDAGLADGNFDYVVVADFATTDDYVVYRDHPEHQRVIAELIKPRVAQRAAVQYEF